MHRSYRGTFFALAARAAGLARRFGLRQILPGRSPPISKPSGLSQIYDQLRPELLRFLTARTANPAEAEDLMQELWLRAQDASRGPVANGRAYLYRAAQNLVLDRIRETRRRERRDRDWSDLQADPISGDRVDPRPQAIHALIARQDIEALRAAISNLPEGAGRAFRLHKIEGLSHAETAARLGISRSGVEKHIAVAMARLRRALED